LEWLGVAKHFMCAYECDQADEDDDAHDVDAKSEKWRRLFFAHRIQRRIKYPLSTYE
jgi:hypothetical protein